MNKAEREQAVRKLWDVRTLSGAMVAGGKQERLLRNRLESWPGIQLWRFDAMWGWRRHCQIQQLFECWNEIFSSVLGRSIQQYTSAYTFIQVAFTQVVFIPEIKKCCNNIK